MDRNDIKKHRQAMEYIIHQEQTGCYLHPPNDDVKYRSTDRLLAEAIDDILAHLEEPVKPVPNRCGSMHVSEILGRRQCELEVEHDGPHASLNGNLMWDDVQFRVNFADEESEKRWIRTPNPTFWQRFKAWWTE